MTNQEILNTFKTGALVWLGLLLFMAGVISLCTIVGHMMHFAFSLR